MVSKHRVISNLYRDSVSLMQVSSTLASREGVQEAYAVMATPANLDLLRDAGVDVGAISAGPNDVVIVIEGEDEGAVEEGLAAAEDVLFREETPVARASPSGRRAPSSSPCATCRRQQPSSRPRRVRRR